MSQIGCKQERRLCIYEEEKRPKDGALGHTRCNREPIGTKAFHHDSLLSARKVATKPSEERAGNTIIFKFEQQQIVWYSVEGFGQVKINGINLLATSNRVQNI